MKVIVKTFCGFAGVLYSPGESEMPDEAAQWALAAGYAVTPSGYEPDTPKKTVKPASPKRAVKPYGK